MISGLVCDMIVMSGQCRAGIGHANFSEPNTGVTRVPGVKEQLSWPVPQHSSMDEAYVLPETEVSADPSEASLDLHDDSWLLDALDDHSRAGADTLQPGA